MRAVEESAFAAGVSAEQLMEEAGAAIAREVQATFPTPGLCLAVFGKGNNGGDALVAARHLAAAGWDTRLIGAFPGAKWKDLPRAKFKEAGACRTGDFQTLENARGTPVVVLDGLLGIGSESPLHEDIATYTRAINALRERSNAHVFALDLPTGLNGDTGSLGAGCVVADTTLTIGYPKAGLVSDEAANHVGRIRVLQLAELSKRAGSASLGAVVADAAQLRASLPRRKFDTHKGTYGRVGIMAGSPGMLGAAALCAEACIRGGAGLVTLYATPDAAHRLSLITTHEVMVKSVAGYSEVPVATHDVLAVGPGLGQHHADEVIEVIRSAKIPMVVDADALNSLALQPAVLADVAAARVLTPHPGEMSRLAPDLAGQPRADIVRHFTHRFPKITLLLKGARTLVGQSGEHLSYNSTGTPGMASGGMGDVLTGVIAALLGQNVKPFEAAQLGAWLCGRAGELAIDAASKGESEESLTAGRLMNWLGPAFRALRAA